MPRILFFSLSIGAGHDQTAKAILEEVTRRYPDALVELVDTFNYINPLLDKVVKGSYLEALKFSPKAWGYLYDQAEQDKPFIDLRSVMNKLLAPKLQQLVQTFQPDLMICSHAFPCGMLSALKQRYQLNVPLLAAVTDYTIHPFWIYPEVDAYIIPSEQLQYHLLAAGIPAAKIWPLGLPIRPEFGIPLEPSQARKELGLRDCPTILLMGGGLGLGALEEITNLLLASQLPVQIVVICGKNQKLQAKLEKLQASLPTGEASGRSLVVLGYTDKVAGYMYASDVLISKPGGLTAAEVLACQLPLLIIDPIPGQEARNTDFLLNHGLALKITELRELIPTLQQLLNCPLKLKQVKEMAALLGKPKAATAIVDRIAKEYLVP